MGRRKQQKPKRATETEGDSKSSSDQNLEDIDEEEDLSDLKKFKSDTSDRSWLNKLNAKGQNFAFDACRLNAELAWLQWQQQNALRETRLKFGLSDEIQGPPHEIESPLDLSGNRLPPSGTGLSPIHQWQQQLILLKENSKDERERIITPAMPATTSSLALLRSFAALSEKFPQMPPSLLMADQHLQPQIPTFTLSALQQISQLTNQLSTGARLPAPASGPPPLLMQRPPMWSQVGLPPVLPSGVHMSKMDLSHMLKCITCHQTYPTLEGLSRHLKESEHGSASEDRQRHQELSSPIRSPSFDSRMSYTRSSSPPHSPKLSSPKGGQGAMPRKLVRGQDVWLGKGQEQTRQILKCMWCGQSFPSLADLTVHMQETKHYTKVISQEQIAAWNCGPQSPTLIEGKQATNHHGQKKEINKTHLSSIFTCKVCSLSFSNLRDLSVHMASKVHQADSTEETSNGHSDNQIKAKALKVLADRKKKALPVRKLLEIERAANPTTSDNGTKTYLDEVIHVNQNEVDENDSVNGDSSKRPTSILGSLEKLVENSFAAEMHGRKRSLPANGILQRLGIDEEIPMTNKIDGSTKKTSSQIFDFFRSNAAAHWNQTSARFPEDYLENANTVETGTRNASANPLFALKELCNINNARPRMKPEVDSESSSPNLNDRSTPSTFISPSPVDTGLEDDRKSENKLNVATDRGHSKSPNGSHLQFEPDENENTSQNSGQNFPGQREYSKDAMNGNSSFEGKDLRSSRSRKTRKDEISNCRNEVTTVPATGTKRKKTVSPSQEISSTEPTSAEAKFFRYSELAKQLAAGN